MYQRLMNWLVSHDIPNPEWMALLGMLGLILFISVLIHLLLHRGIVRLIHNLARDSQQLWHTALFERKLFHRVAFTLQGVVISVQANLWLPAESGTKNVVLVLAQAWILLLAMLTFFALLDTVISLSRNSRVSRNLPLRGIFQGLKLGAAILVSILLISLLIGKSPVILFSGLGAMTAVLLLVFKDPILGLVAGIQLSANKMLAVGDWLEMPKYGADGDVLDITLTTVKVQNWDRTITTVPTYALISDSFKNWRGMTESGGRRIKRSLRIDGTSVHFLNEEELTRLRKAKLLSAYIEQKIADIAADNAAQGVDLSSPVNGRRLTNLGTFRAYLTAYLKANKHIHSEMIQMVRQLEPDANGVPLEIYAFTNKTGWVDYEGIQSDLFDHILAVLPEFGLRLHQSPTGADFQRLLKG